MIPTRTISGFSLVRESAREQLSLASLASRVAALERLVGALQAGHGPRDAADETFVAVLAARIGGVEFGARELVAHAHVDAELGAALLATDCQSPREVGKLLRRLAGRAVGGLRLERCGQHRDGLRWRVQVCDYETRAAGPG